jgi:gliding motility-associated-like protein
MVSWLTFCQYYDAPRLQAMGDSVLWYASSVAAGAGSLTGPVPSTSAPGNMFYYSSQTTSGCTSAIDSTQVTILPKPVVTAPGDTTLCPGDSIILSAVNADPGAIFSWSPSLYLGGTSGRVTTSSPETSVTYSVIATNQYGCTDTGKVSISVYPAAVIALGDSVTIYSGQSYQVSTQSNCVSFIWYPPAGLNDAFIANPIASPAINTKYIVNASTQDGCTAADSINVYVSNSAALALPNAFTPGTGANGVFKIINEGISKLNYFRIYDRWGVKVFETTNAETGWDGAYNGTPQPQGVYVYELSASGSDGSAFVKQGNITLLR